MTLFGGIEAGGTKFVCAVGTGPGDLRVRTSFPTTTPAETIAQAITFFKQQPELVAAVGIGAFGPVDPNPASPTYGYITSTPKLAWQFTDIRGAIARGLGVPVGFDTDVNVAAIGEHRWGASQDVASSVYITVGTGIGGGGMANGRLMHGLVHPEVGHMRIPHDRARDPFDGVCPYHGDCLEGLASGEALRRRWDKAGEDLTDPAVWELEAEYLALGLVNLVCACSPERIILGGGVMRQPVLLPLVRRRIRELLAGYIEAPELAESIDDFVVAPALGERAGLLGAIELARQAVPAA